jgi:TolB-like protein/Tfp pilus assembly protein PilF
MSSLVPGFEYDVFISYRHKDDKYDRWVTNFVRNLKRELDATFRDEVSVYFDSNKSDGLLATHDVDESLKDKLRCLVFIPVISHTYCDPASFAWANEFKIFVQQASATPYGLKVKLPNGNYASRVLPVIIHDLAAEEKVLCERILGSKLRGIEFIYSEPGVNRPLRSIEDNPNNNLARTNYRNQINKVANAVKEIISAIEGNGLTEESDEDESILGKEAVFDKKNRAGKWKSFAGVFIALLLISAGVIYIPGMLKPDKAIEKSIAVLPFINDSRDQQNSVLVNGLMGEILNSLQSFKGLRVLSRNSVEQYRGITRPSTPEIAKSLGVNYLVEGSVQESGNSLRLQVQLIRAIDKEANLWSKSFQLNLSQVEDIFNLQSEIAKSIADELNIALTPEEKNIIEAPSTTNLEAYGYYQQARDLINTYWRQGDFSNTSSMKMAASYFRKTLQQDSSFSGAYSGLAYCYCAENLLTNRSGISVDSLFYLIDSALQYDESNSEAYLVESWYFLETGEKAKALKANNTALKYNPNNWEAYWFRTFIYKGFSEENNFVNALEALKTTMTLNKGKNLPSILNQMGEILGGFAGFHDEAAELFAKAVEISGDSIHYYINMSSNENDRNNRAQALKYNLDAYRIDSSRNDLVLKLGHSYLDLGKYDSALLYFKDVLGNYKRTGVIQKSSLHRIAFAFSKTGDTRNANYWFREARKSFEESVANNDFEAAVLGLTYYDLAGLLAFIGEEKKALENLGFLDNLEVCPKWLLTLIKFDPLLESIRDEKKFDQVVSVLESKYLAERDRVGIWLAENKTLFE